MGQKVNRNAFSVAYKRSLQFTNTPIYKSIWFSEDKKEIQSFVYEDFLIRQFLLKFAREAMVSDIYISRGNDRKPSVSMYVAKPSVLVGKQEKMDEMRKELISITGSDVKVSISSIKNPELDAAICAANICLTMEKSSKSCKKIAKTIMSSAMKIGAVGVTVLISGRINGAEIARSEEFSEGSMPLSTLRADISYASDKAITKYGVIGVKVWVNRGVIG